MTFPSKRPWTLDQREGTMTRVRVKRTCENCHRPIGDVTESEMDAAVAGVPLPNVADECGCVEVVEQLAMFSQRYDAINYGTTTAGVSHPTWDELGPDAREEYLKEATNTVRAMVHLGWAPLQRVLDQIGEKP